MSLKLWRLKRQKYAELGSKFLPLVFETHGRMNDVAENTLKLLAKMEAAKLLDLSSIEEAREECGAEWSTMYSAVVARSRQFLSAVLAKQMALAVKYGVADTMASGSSSPDFGSGRRVDPLDDELVSAALCAPCGCCSYVVMTYVRVVPSGGIGRSASARRLIAHTRCPV